MEETKRLRGFLGDRGLRMTAVRAAVAAAVEELEGHFDADRLQEHLKARGKRISRATVYRTLKLLADSGIVKETGRGREGARYEHVLGHAHHDHLECVRCGTLIEFVSPGIEKLQEAACREHGFTPTEHRLTIRGLCAACARGDTRSAGTRKAAGGGGKGGTR